jgi:hypothetical protein
MAKDCAIPVLAQVKTCPLETPENRLMPASPRHALHTRDNCSYQKLENLEKRR